MTKRFAGAAMWACGLALLALAALGVGQGSRAIPLDAGLARCAQIGPLPCVAPVPPPPSPQTITFDTETSTASCGTSCTPISGGSIGAVCPNRVVVVAFSEISISNAAANSASGTTIGGTTATVIQENNANNGTNNVYSGILAVALSTGTTATVVAANSQSMSRLYAGMWTICNVQSTTKKNSLVASIASNTLTYSMNTVAGDVGVGAFFTNGTASATTTWTGATKRYDDNTQGSVGGGADFTETTTQTPRTITAATAACASNSCAGVAASWH